MFNIIDEFFYDIDKKQKKENKVDINLTKEEAIDSFLAEVENYLGDYAKERTIKSSEEILELCDEFEYILGQEDIFLYYKAFGSFLGGDYKTALLDSKSAINKNNQAFEYYVLIGKIYEKLQDETKAITSFMRALDLNPKSLEALKKLGFIYMAILNLEQGLDCFERAYLLDQEDHEIYSGLAGCSFELGEVEKSLEYITKAITLESSNANYYYNRAIINRVMSEYDKSIYDYRKTIEIEPAYTIAYFYLADLYIQLKMIDEAKDVLEDVLVINDKYSDAYMKMSYCHLLENDFDKALEDITKAIEIDGTNPEFYYKRAAIYITQNEDELALDDYLTLMMLDSKNPIIYDIIGKIYMEKEEYETAKDFFEKALELDKSESFYGNIAICDYHLKNLKEAKENFTKSIELSSQNIAEDYFFRGKCSYYLEEGDKGKADFEMTLTLHTEESIGALYYLSYIEYSLENFEQCIEYINDYFLTEDDEYIMLRMLSAAYTETKNYIMARDALHRCLEISDKKAEIYNDIALSYYNQENLNKAMYFYNKAIDENSELCIAYSNRALVKEDKKQYMSAIKDYEKALELKDDIIYYFGIANCYDKLSKKTKTYKTFKQICDREDVNILVIEEIGNFYKDKEEYDKAIEFYEKALNYEQSKISVIEKLIEVYKALKDKQKTNFYRNVLKEEKQKENN